MKHSLFATTIVAFGAFAFLSLEAIPPARAADSVGVRGTIISMDGSMLIVKNDNGGATAVALKDGWKLAGISRATPDDIKPGEFVGIASAPTTAGASTLEVLIFPPASQGAGGGNYPWGLTQPSTMTGATVSYTARNAEARTLTLSYHGLERRIAIADGTTVMTFVPATRTDLIAGAPVFVPAERGEDGVLVSALVVVGGKGVVSPM
jgi:hypothetical protein